MSITVLLESRRCLITSSHFGQPCPYLRSTCLGSLERRNSGQPASANRMRIKTPACAFHRLQTALLLLACTCGGGWRSATIRGRCRRRPLLVAKPTMALCPRRRFVNVRLFGRQERRSWRPALLVAICAARSSLPRRLLRTSTRAHQRENRKHNRYCLFHRKSPIVVDVRWKFDRLRGVPSKGLPD